MKKKTFKLTGIQKIDKTWVIEGELEDGREVKLDVGGNSQLVEVDFDAFSMQGEKNPEIVRGKGRRIIGRG